MDLLADRNFKIETPRLLQPRPSKSVATVTRGHNKFAGCLLDVVTWSVVSGAGVNEMALLAGESV